MPVRFDACGCARADRLEKLKGFEPNGDRYQIAGRDIFLLFRQSIRNSKLAIQVDKLGVPATGRNWKTISRLVAMSDEMAKVSD